MEDKERLVVLETEMKQVKGDIAKILENQVQMKDQLTRYKGFIGGIMFIGSCVWAGLALVGEAIARKFGF